MQLKTNSVSSPNHIYSDRKALRLRGVPPAPVLQLALASMLSMIHRWKDGNLLLKGVGARSPPGQEDRQADSLEQLGEDADTHLLKRTLLNEELAEELLPVSNAKLLPS